MVAHTQRFMPAAGSVRDEVSARTSDVLHLLAPRDF